MSALTFRKILNAPQFGSHKLGQSLDAVVAKATKLSVQPSPTNAWRQTNLDYNGDGLADAQLYENLDPSGKVTSRTLTESVNGVNYSLRDSNADGKIDGFDRDDLKGGYSVNDVNGDGKADAQSTWLASGVQHYFADQDYDGKVDYRTDTRKATSKDVFQPLPTVPGLEAAKLGASLDAQIPSDARQISWNEGANSVMKSWDTNGDWVADITEYQTLNAQREVVSSSLTLNGATPDGAPAAVTLTDSDNDGMAEMVNVGQGSSWVAVSDPDHDGKINWETVGGSGQNRYLNDTDADGNVDLVTTWATLS